MDDRHRAPRLMSLEVDRRGMQVDVISDIHTNRVPLDAVFEDMPPVEGVVCAGDVVGYNPWPGDCIDRVRDREIPTFE